MHQTYWLGVLAGLASGLGWAVNTTLIGVSLRSPVLDTITSTHAVPFLSNFLNDIFVFTWMLLAVLVTRSVHRAKTILLSRKGLVLMVAGVLGGPLGMLFYVLGVDYAGVDYTAVLSSSYPVVGAVIAALVLKEKLMPRNYLGVFLIVLAVALLSWKSLHGLGVRHLVGIGFAFLAAVGWGAQAVFLSWGMREGDVPQHIALLITVGTALCVDLAVLLPAVDALSWIWPVIFSTSGEIAFAASMMGAFATWIYYIAIHAIGPTKAMGLDITYGLWAVLIGVWVLGAPFSLRMFLAAIGIVGGVLLTISVKRQGSDG